MGKNSFILYTDYEEKLAPLSDKELGEIIRNIFVYLRTGKVQKMDRALSFVFNFIKVELDKNNENYERIVERNKENGKKGGRPKTTKTQKNPKNPVGSKKADTDTDTDIKIIINNYFYKKEIIKERFYEFLEVRKKLKAVNTPRAIKLLLKDLDNATDIEKLVMIEKSIKNSWKSFYELKPHEKQKLVDVPDWFDKTIEKEKLTKEEQNEIEKLLEEFK
ncbi:MAG: hypothetical protein IJO32_00400 [Bacilli bacterium]|nr:hypothetical protein [Bacilli bacterium]